MGPVIGNILKTNCVKDGHSCLNAAIIRNATIFCMTDGLLYRALLGAGISQHATKNVNECIPIV